MRSMTAAGAGGLALVSACLMLGVLGCSKKVTDPNSRPAPEGQQGQMLMMGWHEQGSVWFVIHDPGTPDNPFDDFVGEGGTDYWADTAGVRTSTLDLSQSNQLEAFRVGSDGNVAQMFDFLLDPTVRFIGTNLEDFDFEDFKPLPNPKYYGRGVLNGQITTASPITNQAGAFQTCDNSLNFIPAPKAPPGDSVLDVRFEDDPRAAFYVVEISNASGVLGTGDVYSNLRRLYGIPSPLLPGSQALNRFTYLLPAGSGTTGIQARLSRQHWPLFFHIRVSAFDAGGRMVNRVNDYLHTRQTSSGTNLEAYEPLGGAVEVLDPYPDSVHPISPPVVLTFDEAMTLLASRGGLPGPGLLSRLAGSEPAGSLTSSPAFSEVLGHVSALPAFSMQASEQRFRAIRAKLGNPTSVPR